MARFFLRKERSFGGVFLALIETGNGYASDSVRIILSE
jgi:hypothetical protein